MGVEVVLQRVDAELLEGRGAMSQTAAAEERHQLALFLLEDVDLRIVERAARRGGAGVRRLTIAAAAQAAVSVERTTKSGNIDSTTTTARLPLL